MSKSSFLKSFGTLTLAGLLAIPSMVFAWDLGSATYDNVSLSAQSRAPAALYFRSDGAVMYEIDTSTDDVFQHTLSTPWDLSTATYTGKNFDVRDQESTAEAIFFKDDGTKMYIVGWGLRSVLQYTLSTAWDVSTASYDSVLFDVSSQEFFANGVTFSSSGAKMYIIGPVADKVFQYTLSTPWDLSTASYDSVSFDVSGQDSSPEEIFFKSDGNTMYMVGSSSDSVYQYTLSTAWDVSTASYDSVSRSVNSQDSTPEGLFFKSDGTKMYMSGNATDSIYQYSLELPLPAAPQIQEVVEPSSNSEPLSNPELSIALDQGLADKAGHRTITTDTQTITLTTKPPDQDRLQSLTLKLNNKTYPLTPHPKKPELYTVTLKLPDTSKTSYVLSANYGTIIHREYGTIIQTSASTSKPLLPFLNSLYRTAHNQEPTPQAWSYWAGRMLQEVKALDAWLGAMQWQALFGSTN